MNKTVFCFTHKYEGLVNALLTVIQVAPAFDPNQESQHSKYKEFVGIWDTGATSTVISRRVVDELDLKPVGIAKVSTAGGEKQTQVYYVNFSLPNKVGFQFWKVIEGEIKGVDLLIGMDVISKGDFAVSNKDGKTTFTFRIPSVQAFDFVETPPPGYPSVPPKLKQKKHLHSPNKKCPCGSGKKYKNCCMDKLES